MKNLLKHLMVIAIVFSLASCTSEILQDENSVVLEEQMANPQCASQNPKARLTNNSTQVASFEIYDNNGVLIGSAYNIQPGSVTNWKSFSAGTVQILVNTTVSQKAIGMDLGTCMGYDVTIDANNQLDTDQPITF